MRVVLNGLAALKPKTGVGHHVADLSAALRSTFPADEFTLFPGGLLGKAVHLCQKRTTDSPAIPATPSLPRRLARWVVRTGKSAAQMAARLHFAAYTRTFRFDLYHEPNFVPFPTHLPTVITVHDLSVLKYPHWHPADRVRHHQQFFLRGIGKARHVIVVSEAVRREMIEELGCPSDRVTAVHNGLGPHYVPQSADKIEAARRKWDLPARFFLCVGTIEPRKNLATVMRAFLALPADIRAACPLVLVGPWGWRSEDEHELYDTKGKAAGIRHIGYLPGDDLPAVYAAARVLLYPSHYEGFGFPPIEMLACGGAVVASTAEAVREVVDGSAHFVEPDDLDGWRTAMKRAATDDDFVQRIKGDGPDRAKRYSWDRAARETVDVYRYVLSRGERRTPPALTRIAA